MTEPSGIRRDIVVWPRRGSIIFWAILLAALALLMVVVLVAIFFPIFMGGIVFGASDIPLASVVVLLFLGGGALTSYLSWRMISMIYPVASPVLTVNDEGIRVGKMPGYNSCFIPWSEIARIAPYSYIVTWSLIYRVRRTNLCITPKDTERFLAQFRSLERLSRRMDTKGPTHAPLACPDGYMARGMSVEWVISQIATRYKDELIAHNILLQRGADV